MKLLVAIAAGGALGALGRHYVSFHVGAWVGHQFPWGTLAVNVAGGFALGVLAELMALAWSPSLELRALLTVGLLGGFTTFSTFSLETVLLMERGAFGQAFIYALASLTLSVGALFAGLRLVRVLAAG